MNSNDVAEIDNAISVNSISASHWNEVLLVQNVEMEFRIDSGSQVNIIPYREYIKLHPRPKLNNTSIKLSAYNNTTVPVRGKCICQVHCRDKKVPIIFIVTDDNLSPIIGADTSERLGLITRIRQINSKDSIPVEFSDCFGEIGCLDKLYHIELNPDIQPVIAPSQKIPHSLKPRLKQELERMIKLHIIEPVVEPTEWVNAMVIVEKPNGKLRICLDPRPLNKAIKRHRYQLPTAEEIFSEMQGAAVFSKLDASSGYWQVPVDEESSYLLTFMTPFGRYRFKRMPYGIHSASEIFQKVVSDIIADIPHAINSQDDIIIWGTTQKEHDETLRKVLECIRSSGLKLNKSKCKFSESEVTFLGHKLSSEGLQVDPKKCSAITDMPTPTNKTELQRFLGMINYIGKFIPNLSEVTAPLRILLGKDIEFMMEKPQVQAIDNLKRLVTTAPTLNFFDPNRATRLKTDASSAGLGALIEQKDGDEWKPIGYASRSLNTAEVQYAQIEKETLSIVFGCEKFHEYLYGYDFTVLNDHKPLSTIFNKSLHKAPPRIQRLYLRLLKYRFTFEHTPGKQMLVADALSRTYINDSSNSTEVSQKNMIAHVHLVLDNLPISKRRLYQIQAETKKDDVMKLLKDYTLNGWPPKHQVDLTVRPCAPFQDEIWYHSGILLKGDCIIIPASLRKEMLTILHQDTLGL